MSTRDDLNAFVRAALKAGQPRDDISNTLTAAGWSRPEAQNALSGWADAAAGDPVPRPRNVISARDFFIYVLTFAALITTALNLVFLLFDFISLALDDHDNTRWLYRSMRNNIAALIVAGPLYVWLTAREGRLEKANPARKRSAIRNWTTSLMLLGTSILFMGNLIWTLATFLNGDLTLAFTLETLVIAVVAGGLFLFYLRDYKEDAA